MKTAWDTMKGDIEDEYFFDEVEVWITVAEEAANSALLESEESQVSGNATGTAPSASLAGFDATFRPTEVANSALLDSEKSLKTREAQAQVSGDAADMAPSASHTRIDAKLCSKHWVMLCLRRRPICGSRSSSLVPIGIRKCWKMGTEKVRVSCRIVDSNLIWRQPCYRLSRSHQIRQSEGILVAWPRGGDMGKKEPDHEVVCQNLQT